jgi:hypothetical protein
VKTDEQVHEMIRQREEAAAKVATEAREDSGTDANEEN